MPNSRRREGPNRRKATADAPIRSIEPCRDRDTAAGFADTGFRWHQPRHCGLAALARRAVRGRATVRCPERKSSADHLRPARRHLRLQGLPRLPWHSPCPSACQLCCGDNSIDMGQSVVLSVGRSLPVSPQLRTFSAPVGMSQRCRFCCKSRLQRIGAVVVEPFVESRALTRWP